MAFPHSVLGTDAACAGRRFVDDDVPRSGTAGGFCRVLPTTAIAEFRSGCNQRRGADKSRCGE
jgi:hypothetical protein